MPKRIIVRDELVADFLFMYCEGKPALWRMFFGWQGTSLDCWTFWVSRKTYQSAKDWAGLVRDNNLT